MIVTMVPPACSTSPCRAASTFTLPATGANTFAYPSSTLAWSASAFAFCTCPRVDATVRADTCGQQFVRLRLLQRRLGGSNILLAPTPPPPPQPSRLVTASSLACSLMIPCLASATVRCRVRLLMLEIRLGLRQRCLRSPCTCACALTVALVVSPAFWRCVSTGLAELGLLALTQWPRPLCAQPSDPRSR